MSSPKTIVITGASAGIGAAIAHRLAQGGHNLVLAARGLEDLRRVSTECEAAGAVRAVAVTADVRDREQVVAVAAAAIDAFGGFDVWINNAGRGIDKSVLDLSGDDFDEIRLAAREAMTLQPTAKPDGSDKKDDADRPTLIRKSK